jgi:hypothetical protein
MNVYKVELMIINHDEMGQESVKRVLENANYPNDCISPDVVSIESRDIGEWSDDNPLNFSNKKREEFNRLFRPTKDEKPFKRNFDERCPEGSVAFNDRKNQEGVTHILSYDAGEDYLAEEVHGCEFVGVACDMYGKKVHMFKK